MHSFCDLDVAKAGCTGPRSAARDKMVGAAGFWEHLGSSLYSVSDDSFLQRPEMTDHDTERMLGWIDSALELFHVNEGKLNAREIRIRSMLAVVRNELSDNLHRKKVTRDPRDLK
jgi:hypothetical protein